MSLHGVDTAHTLTVGPAIDSSEQRMFVTPYLAADPRTFDGCPICLSTTADSKEHVGPEAIGGRYMTRTCRSCNNDLGRLLDKALVEWCTSSWERITLRSPNVLTGERKLKNALFRMTEHGEPVWILNSDPGADVRRAFGSSELSALSMPGYNMYRLQFAALKNAYLAVALLTESVPCGGEADEVRRLLVAVRDAPRGAPLPQSPLVRSMVIARSKTAPDGPAVAVTAMTHASGERLIGLSFSGVLSTSWPLPSIPIPMSPPEKVWARRPV